MIQLIIFAVFMLTISIIVHEIGHYWYWKRFINHDVRYSNFKVIGKYEQGEVSKLQMVEYHLAGVFAGMLFLWIFCFVSWTLGFAVMFLYLIGCISDFKRIMEVMKE